MMEYDQLILEKDKKIKEYEADLGLAQQIDVEIDTIKEAAAQVDYKIDELSDRQKQILIGLFVDKVEVSKTYDEDGKRNVKAKVIFRFNPQHMKEQLIGVSTEKALPVGMYDEKTSIKDEGGAIDGD